MDEVADYLLCVTVEEMPEDPFGDTLVVECSKCGEMCWRRPRSPKHAVTICRSCFVKGLPQEDEVDAKVLPYVLEELRALGFTDDLIARAFARLVGDISEKMEGRAVPD